MSNQPTYPSVPVGQYVNSPPPYSQATDTKQLINQQPTVGQGQQPQFDADGWMTLPSQAPAGIPIGLHYLSTIDQLLIKQKVEMLEVLTGWETNNKYTIKNNRGEKVYYAVEDTDCCTRMCCGPMRPFDLKILDIYRNEVIHLRRPLACTGCCFPCCLQTLEVYLNDGKLAGSVEETWSLCAPKYDIKNENGDTVLKIEGPFCVLKCCAAIDFNVLSLDKQTEVGKITKQWGGFTRELFTDADYFGVSFPVDLDVRMKAVLIGACFLIDFMYFERKG